MKKTIVCLVAIFTVFLFGALTSVQATSLPWLDFGSNMVWNSNTNTLSDGGLAYVNSLTYRDGTIVPPPFVTPTDNVLFKQVSFSISFDGDNTNDWITIGSIFSAGLHVVGSPADPLNSTPNPYVVNIESQGLSLNTGAGSQWANELDSVLDRTLLYPARLNISWSGLSRYIGNGDTIINANGKISPVPEPVTLMLFGSGLVGLYYVRRSKTFKI